MAVDNSDMKAKILIREWLLEQMGGAINCSVLELYGGMGHVFDQCYTEVPKHMAFELRKVDRPTWVQGDNRMLLKTNAQGWDLYDVDAYASPWLVANDIMRLREPGKFALAITDGVARSLCTNQINGFVRQRIGLNGMAQETGLLHRWRADIVKWLMLDWERFGVKVLEAKYIPSIYSQWIHYYGVTCIKE